MLAFEVESAHPYLFVRDSAPQLGGVDGTALEVPARTPSGDSSATFRRVLVDDPLGALRTSLLTHEDDGAVLGDDEASLSPMGPVAGHLEREVASTETSVTDNKQTAVNVGMAFPKRRSMSENGSLVLNGQQTGLSELLATAADIQEKENTRGTIDSAGGSSEAVAENDTVRVSEESSGSDFGTTITSTAEGGVLAAPVGVASGRGSAIVTSSGSEREDVSDVGAVDGAVELPRLMTVGGELSAEGTSDVVDTSRTSSTQQESAAEITAPQPSTGGILQHTPGGKNSMTVAPMEGACVDCTLDGPAQTSPLLIEAVVARYLHLAVAKVVATAVPAPEADAPSPDEVRGNLLLNPHTSSSALEKLKEADSPSKEQGVESTESGSIPEYVSGITPNDTEADETRGGNSSASAVCAAAAPLVSIENQVVRDYLEQVLPTTTRAEVVAMAMETLRDRSLSPAESFSEDEAANLVFAENVSGEDGEVGGSGLGVAKDLGEETFSPTLAEHQDETEIEEGRGKDAHEMSNPGLQISVAAQRLVDDVTARSLMMMAAVVTARARDTSYACAPPTPAKGIGDTNVSLCKSLLEDKRPTEGSQTPRTTRSESTSPASVSSQDREDRGEGDISPSAAWEAESFCPRDLADGDNFTVHEAPQIETALAPKCGEPTPRSESEPSSQQGNIPAADGVAPATDVQSIPSVSVIIDDDDCVTSADDMGQIDCERFVPISGSPLSAKKRAVADYLEDVVREAVTAVGRMQGVGETPSDTGKLFPIAAQVHLSRAAQDTAVIIASEEESSGVPAPPAEVVDGNTKSTDAIGTSAAEILSDHQSETDSDNPRLLSSDYVQGPAAADSLAGACGAIAAEGSATVEDPAAQSVHSEPSSNGDETLAGVLGADFVQEQREASSVQPGAETEACSTETIPAPDGGRATDPSTLSACENAAGTNPLLMMPQEIPAGPPLLSPSIEDPCCSSTLHPDGSEGRRSVFSPDFSATVTVNSASAKEAPVERHASGSPSSCASLRCRVVADYLSDKLTEAVAAETASQVRVLGLAYLFLWLELMIGARRYQCHVLSVPSA